MVDQATKAAAFRALHADGTFVLPNAWDAGSAAMIEAAGAAAVATTSAGVSWAQGRPDVQQLSRGEMVAAVARIVDTVGLPVSADVEGGYGEEPAAVATTVRDVVGAGVGVGGGPGEDVGADGLFVPGLLDLDALTTLTGKVSLPVNVMVGPGAPDVATLRASGVRRISLGQAISQAAYSLARRAAVEALTTGTYDTLAGADDFGAVNGAFSRPTKES